MTDAELAAELKIPLQKLHELRQRDHWPCTRLGRFIYRFTPDQVQQVLALYATAPQKKPAALAAVQGQTKRSAARARTG